MRIDYNTFKDKVLFKFGVIAASLSIIAIICTILIRSELENKIKNLNESRLNYLYSNFTDDKNSTYFMNIACMLTRCYTVYVQEPESGGYREYHRDKPGFLLKRDDFLASYREMTVEYNKGLHSWITLDNNRIIIKYPTHTILISEIKPLTILYGFLIILFISFSLAYFMVYYDFKANTKKQITNKFAIHDKLRLELTESLHHELAGPISVLESNVKYFIRENLKYEYVNEGKCGYYTNNSTLIDCDACSSMGTDVGERLNSTLLVIESMKSILGTMSSLKKMKYQKDSLIISVMLDSVAALNRITTYNVTNINVMDRSLTSEYYINGTLSDGILFNSIMTLINNSNEAGATQISIIPKVEGSVMSLYLSDNGSGIRDKKGNIDKDPERIFRYGYTTKEDSSSDAGVMTKILHAFTTFDITTTSTRGAGLAITRKFLRECGGDVVIERTSEEGTIIKISFPVINKNIKEKR